MEEELKLLRFYQKHIQKVCGGLGLPPGVTATALCFFKRFYLAASPLDHEPRTLMLTCIYVACKAEECYMPAEEFCRKVSQEPAGVLRSEVPLLQGLHFDLVVYSPQTSLAAFWQVTAHYALRGRGPWLLTALCACTLPLLFNDCRAVHVKTGMGRQTNLLSNHGQPC